jgi:hypothetical protein
VAAGSAAALVVVADHFNPLDRRPNAAALASARPRLCASRPGFGPRSARRRPPAPSSTGPPRAHLERLFIPRSLQPLRPAVRCVDEPWAKPSASPPPPRRPGRPPSSSRPRHFCNAPYLTKRQAKPNALSAAQEQRPTLSRPRFLSSCHGGPSLARPKRSMPGASWPAPPRCRNLPCLEYSFASKAPCPPSPPDFSCLFSSTARPWVLCGGMLWRKWD